MHVGVEVGHALLRVSALFRHVMHLILALAREAGRRPARRPGLRGHIDAVRGVRVAVVRAVRALVDVDARELRLLRVGLLADIGMPGRIGVLGLREGP